MKENRAEDLSVTRDSERANCLCVSAGTSAAPSLVRFFCSQHSASEGQTFDCVPCSASFIDPPFHPTHKQTKQV